MRVTITLSREKYAELRAAARREGIRTSEWMRRAVERALDSPAPDSVPPFRLVTVGGEGPVAGVNLDKCGEAVVADDEKSWANLSMGFAG
jgi:hypothetical protein